MPAILPVKNSFKSFGFENLEAEELKKRTSAVYAAIFTIVAGICHSMIYVFLGFPYVTIVVIAYATCSISSLFYLRFTHNFRVFKVVQLVLISFFPFATQLFIGGFINSSGVAIAGFIAPATALLYAKATSARRYLFLFVILIVAAAFIEHYFIVKSITLPTPIIITFFAINIIATLGIIYFLMESFLKKQEELRIELRKSIEHLKTTQAQLIQSEKMASLGELTAGIAHEIQNPLNFVNNFSEVSEELCGELKEEIQLISISEADKKNILSLLDDLVQNQQKINFHGNRADSIIKNMLLHSRISSGQKEPTDINALADEYLRLAYHGLRAKDKTFNAKIITEFDPKFGKVEIVPQEIGRVLLNLFNNAFYAIQQKKNQLNGHYQPEVKVSTRLLDGQVEIKIRDNGNGIPDNIKNKIFQPFFTTKPTGQGTGLGLSLSYDIITKGHGGELKVETQEGEGSEFIVLLPIA